MSKSFPGRLSAGGAGNATDEKHNIFSEILVQVHWSEGFHTSIIYGAAGLMYGRYRGLGDILRSYSPVRLHHQDEMPELTSVHLPTPAK